MATRFIYYNRKIYQALFFTVLCGSLAAQTIDIAITNPMLYPINQPIDFAGIKARHLGPAARTAISKATAKVTILFGFRKRRDP